MMTALKRSSTGPWNFCKRIYEFIQERLIDHRRQVHPSVVARSEAIVKVRYLRSQPTAILTRYRSLFGVVNDLRWRIHLVRKKMR